MPVLVVQMGHVGRPPCPGSQGTAGEQDFTQRAGQACARLLNREGWVVKVIDADPNYSAVPQLGGNPAYYRGDAYVAIHCDGSTNPDRDGASWGYRAVAAGFAADIKSNYLRRTGRPASWCEPDNYTANLAQYYGLGLAASVGNTRAVIMECGFLTNPNDRAMLLDPSGPDNVALAIGDALGMTLPMEDDVTPEEVWRFPIPEGGTLNAPSGAKYEAWAYVRNVPAAISSKVDAVQAAVRDIADALTRANTAIDTEALLQAIDARFDQAQQESDAALRKALAEGVLQVDVSVHDRTQPTA